MVENQGKGSLSGDLRPLLPGFERNQGRQPRKSIGKRVLVVLMDGHIGKCDPGSSSLPGWAADKCIWERSDYRFAIDQFRVL